MKKEVYFYSEGLKIQADVYYPESEDDMEKYPAVVLCHGFAGIKEILLPDYAQKFTDHGFIALIPDYRGFGKSEGERGRLVPAKQIMDIRNAITYLQTLKQVDISRIGIWGTSFGGANALSVGAKDSRIKAVVVQLTFSDGEKAIMGGLNSEERLKIVSTIQKAWEREVTKNKTLLLSPDRILTDPESMDFYQNAAIQYPDIKTKIPFTALQKIIEYKPKDMISILKCPVLIISAEKDNVCPPEESEILFDIANEPKKLVTLKDCRHYDAYEGKPFEQGADAAVQWFIKFL